MSIRIALDNQPEFYTNLDSLAGRVVLHLSRPEQIGGIIVKLEGESKTALGLPQNYDERNGARPLLPSGGGPGNIASENHKILYRVAQVFPTYEEDLGGNSSVGGSYVIQGGQHEFPFKFKLPINNACSDPVAMSKIGGIGGMGGFGAGIGPFGLGGARVMDGSKQLFLQHVTKTLPPSFTGFPRQAEVRYFIKVTIQRPGFLKENWRYQIGFKFMPIEPPRPPKTSQEAYARRPFTFKPRPQGLQKKKSSLFGSSKDDAAVDADAVPPSIELSARLPHPSILTCNQPIPLRLIAKKLIPSHEQVFLTSIQIELIGKTHVRCHDLFNTEVSRWVVVTQTGLTVPLLDNPASDDLSLESVIPDELWRNIPLPNTVAPSFVACNLQRHYELDIQLGLCWGKPPSTRTFLGSSKDNPAAQTLFLPLHFSKIQVYSGIAPPPQLLEALAQQANRPSPATMSLPPRLPPRMQSAPVTAQVGRPPHVPPQQQPSVAPAAAPQYDPLYPPQIGTPGAASFDDAPPSYDEAMAAGASGPEERPAYSGVTNENAPSQIPEKS
ncbi:arrestin [Colletotrichum sojae]|uniref:Arrestin n=1 Tax=Colletotrichum sojae TaxID=2175907 RepID=A0A8H6N4W8_9PEZI|nr:arrestin [Colletotrichum sojae]